MSNTEIAMALGKVIIAAAWADGNVSREEINSLKDLLFQLPDMTASDWAELEIYIEAPVGEAERARLVDDLRATLSSSSDRAQALAALDAVVAADGQVTDAEQVVIDEIRDTIQNADVGLFGQLGGLLRGPVQRRSQAIASAPNRELEVDDFIKNKIFFKVKHRLELEDVEMDVSEPVLRKLSLAGGLMARVAYVDHDVKDEEFDAMADAFQANWGISQVEATLVVEVAVSEISRNLDYYRLSREFFESTNDEERLHFLDVLYAVADGDGHVSHDEMEEIRTITTVLKLNHKQFIDAKLKIPRERRAY